jgi:hypothetical protein
MAINTILFYQDISKKNSAESHLVSDIIFWQRHADSVTDIIKDREVYSILLCWKRRKKETSLSRETIQLTILKKNILNVAFSLVVFFSKLPWQLTFCSRYQW